MLLRAVPEKSANDDTVSCLRKETGAMVQAVNLVLMKLVLLFVVGEGSASRKLASVRMISSIL